MKIYNYRIDGIPVHVYKVDTPIRRIWDQYSQDKFNYKLALKEQHGHRGVIEGPIGMEANFYFKPKPLKHKSKLLNSHHCQRPSIVPMFQFIEFVARGIIHKHQNLISYVKLKKIYDMEPRTELTIVELDKNK